MGLPIVTLEMDSRRKAGFSINFGEVRHGDRAAYFERGAVVKGPGERICAPQGLCMAYVIYTAWAMKLPTLSAASFCISPVVWV